MPAYQPASRRPIAEGFRRTAQRATRFCVRVGIHADAISYLSIAAAAVAALCFRQSTHYPTLLIVAPLFCYLRLWCNMLDGMVALASGRDSKVGELYNEVPDRVSDAAVFIGAGYAWGGNVALGYIATILAIFTAYVRAAGKIAGAPNEFCGPMAKQHRMLVITVACVYSAVVPRSWQIFRFANLDIGVMALALILIIAGCLVTVVRRLQRIARGLR